jgi:hypothetical protein
MMTSDAHTDQPDPMFEEPPAIPRDDAVHGWIDRKLVAVTNATRTRNALFTVLTTMPNDAWVALQDGGLCAILLGNACYPVRLTAAKPTVAAGTVELPVLVLDGTIEDRDPDMIVAEVAHELAHIALGHDNVRKRPTTDTIEFDACALAIRWGFARETIAMVERDATATATSHGPAWRVCLSRLSDLRKLADTVDAPL